MLRGAVFSEAHRANIAAARVGAQNPQWGKPVAHRRKGRMHETLYEGYQMRSSYEVLFAKRLDRLGVEWEYEPRCFDLGTCTYTPDFYLPETEVFWEVKGWLGPDSQRKTRLFRETFPEISLIVATQPILKPLGAIQ